MDIAWLSEEVLNEQLRPLKKDKNKTTDSVNNNNSKNATNQPQIAHKHG